MSQVVALVPVRSLSDGKTRLAARLTRAERLALSTRLLAGVLASLQAAQTIAACWVISDDPQVGVLAAHYGIETLPELGVDLNDTLAQVLDRLPDDVTHALILPLDLPWLTASAVDTLVTEAIDTHADVVVAPDRWERGTNALLLRRPFALIPAFGVDSLARHIAEAEALGLHVLVYHDPALAFDLDTPTDLAEYAADWPFPLTGEG